MTKTSIQAEQKRIEREIARLQQRAEQLQKKQRAPAIERIVRLMQDFQISPEDIAAAFSKNRPAKKTAPKTARAISKSKVEPKYRHPETGATWTGRGKAPRWISDAEQAGTSRMQFLIQAQGAGNETVGE